MAGRDHPRIGEAGLGSRLILAIDHGDLVPVAGEEVSCGDAGKARAENEDPHQSTAFSAASTASVSSAVPMVMRMWLS